MIDRIGDGATGSRGIAHTDVLRFVTVRTSHLWVRVIPVRIARSRRKFATIGSAADVAHPDWKARLRPRLYNDRLCGHLRLVVNEDIRLWGSIFHTTDTG